MTPFGERPRGEDGKKRTKPSVLKEKSIKRRRNTARNDWNEGYPLSYPLRSPMLSGRRSQPSAWFMDRGGMMGRVAYGPGRMNLIPKHDAYVLRTNSGSFATLAAILRACAYKFTEALRLRELMWIASAFVFLDWYSTFLPTSRAVSQVPSS